MNVFSQFRKSDIFVSLGLVGVLCALLYWRFQLGIVRYFDVDEFAHLHWGYNFFAGYHPYRDYLYFFPPGFLFLLWPVFAVLGKTYAILTVSRVIAFGWFVLLLFMLFLLVKQVRSFTVALLTVVILAWLPLPSDKLLELRPDTPAVVFSLLGMYWLIKMFQCANVSMLQKKRWLLLSGASYGVSLMILPKVVLFLPVAVGCLLFYRQVKYLLFFGIGLFMPMVIVFLFFLWSGDFSRAVYLTTIFANESTKVLGSKFYMLPGHFFYPNDVYYGVGGVSAVLISNHLVYLAGLLGGVFSMASVLFIVRRKEKLPELLLTGSFLINLYAFLRIVPLKHAQYLILLAPFVAVYSAVAIMGVVKRLRFVGLLLLVLFLGIGLYTNWQMYTVKRNWTNASTFTDLKIVTQTIPKDAYVWDLFGETIFYKDPYYICCLPYGQYIEAFGFVPPSLAAALEQTNTQYIFAHNNSRISILPGADSRYVLDHYQPVTTEPLILQKK